MKRLFITWAAAIVLTWGAGALAAAEESTGEEKDQAAESFKTGQELFQKGAHLEAAAAFETAYRLRPHPSVLANIGYCYKAAGDYPRAVEAFRKYLNHPNSDKPGYNAKTAKGLKELESKVGDLRVNCHSLRCEVTVDNVSRGLTPTNVVLLAGTHKVEVEAVNGDQNRHYEIVVRGGGETVLDIDPTRPLSDSSLESTVLSEGTGSEGARLRAPFWVATAVTIIGVGSVSVLAGKNYKNMDDFRRGGSTDTDLQERGENLTFGTNLAVGLTGAAAVTALILAIVDLKRAPEKKGLGQGLAVFPVLGGNPSGGAYMGMNFRFH